MRGPISRAPVVPALLVLLIAPMDLSGQGSGSEAVEARVVEAFCDRQVVLLGELPTHGEARGFQAKAGIVRRLVEECGFEAVLFEAPIYDFLGFQQAVVRGEATPERLDRAIGGFWLTRGLSAWRSWLFEQAVDGRLVLGGLDDQVSASSDHARATLPDLIARGVTPDRSSECREAIERNLFWRYDDAHPFDDVEMMRLQECARAAAEGVDREGFDAAEVAMTVNLASLYDRQRDGGPDRDEAMHRNFRWHADRLPADTRIIVWTATVHATLRQGERDTKPLGARLSETMGDRLAAIGFSAFGGHSSMAGGPVRDLPDAPPGSLEAIATSADNARVYLSREALRELGIVSSRLFGRTTSADWSLFFDAVVVIHEETAPIFDPPGGAN